MRALLDYHHADLAESLHLLLEDRLGITCYLPVGPEWWDEGYWQFGKWTWGDDRLARQFLTRDSVETDGAHPERHHRVLTLAQARDLRWDYVVASVPDNYVGYARFAREQHARFVVQVGNVNQPIDWSLDPIVLNSSEAPIRGRAIQYHQEFSLRTFAYAEPTTTRVVASFVNCMDRMPCYPLLAEAQALLGEFDWRIHGIDGPDGNLKPTSAIADAMRAAGWGWHDKVTGDGFGHVIHNWAAVGRPLIGHAAHYRGTLADQLWQDGVTCIDLDRHSVPEAASMIRDIAADPVRHRRMCLAINGLFRGLVDYDAEAARIAALLA